LAIPEHGRFVKKNERLYDSYRWVAG
jgi:hypothetical protein